MAVAGEIRVCDLLPEFLANALIFLGTLQPAGAIATGACQAFLDSLDHFLIFVKTYCHRSTSLLNFEK